MSKHVTALREFQRDMEVLDRPPTLSEAKDSAASMWRIADHLEKVEAQLRVARKALTDFALGRARCGLEASKAAQAAKNDMAAIARRKKAK